MPDPHHVAATALLVALKGIIPPGAHPDGMLLHSEDIGNKWGFNDGDVPEAVVYMVDAFLGEYRHVDRPVWHAVLHDLVRTRLLPALGNPDASIYLMDSLHNPIRLDAPLPSDFPHGQVRVPWGEVLTKVLLRMPENAPSQ